MSGDVYRLVRHVKCDGCGGENVDVYKITRVRKYDDGTVEVRIKGNYCINCFSLIANEMEADTGESDE